VIEREVSTLAALVNEFSQFVPFQPRSFCPRTRTPLSTKRWSLRCRLDEFCSRRLWRKISQPSERTARCCESVIVNIIDNAAEALENSTCRRVSFHPLAFGRGHHRNLRSDPGHGISPEDKDNCSSAFLHQGPEHGWGSPIAARIVAEQAAAST